MFNCIKNILKSNQFEIIGINFSTYGASLAFLDKEGKRLTPIYNYLKPLPKNFPENFYEKYDGITEFSKVTASPAMKMLNSGLQILRLKKYKHEVFSKVDSTLHLPQYFTFLFTKKIISELTSIGCHTALWDFEKNNYHKRLDDENIKMPLIVNNSKVFKSNIFNKEIFVGTGINDSSASLSPYILKSKNKFLVLSTGTWCISMNPFNYEPLTKNELENDTLCYMSILKKPVKSSRLFMGHIHDVNTKKIAEHFNVNENFFKKIKFEIELLNKINSDKIFFKNSVSENYIDSGVKFNCFENAELAYIQLMIDLTKLCIKSIKYIIPEKDETNVIYVTGGFSKNQIFIELLKIYFPEKEICISELNNASALGAAMVIYESIGMGKLQLII